MWKEIYSYATQSEVYLDEKNLSEQLSKFRADVADKKKWDSLPDFDSIRLLELECLRKKQAILADWENHISVLGGSNNLPRQLVLNSATLASSLGVWLQGVSAPGTFEQKITLLSLTLLADDYGVGLPKNSRRDRIAAFGRSLGISSYTTQAHHLVSDTKLTDDLFALPAILYLLSCRSDAFLPQLAGIDYAFRVMGMLPAWGVLEEHYPEQKLDFMDMNCPLADVIPEGKKPLDLSLEMVNLFWSDDIARHSLFEGVEIVLNGISHWHDVVAQELRSSDDINLAMARFLQGRSREASVYHQKYKMEGKCLSDMFIEAKDNPFPLLASLARSRLVRPGYPEQSPLISSLTRVNGPMFRVFDDGDLNLVRRWIENLPESDLEQYTLSQCSAYLKKMVDPSPVTCMGDSSIGVSPKNIREAYFCLQGRALTPKLSQFSVDYIKFWLKHSEASLDISSRSLPVHYHPNKLRPWLLETHERQNQQLEDNPQNYPTRHEVIIQTLQLAPLTLIDGSWLQGFTDIKLATSRHGARLFQTYWDELGNGDYKLNHPKIYRDVLATMGVRLAETGTFEFSFDKRLEEKSFALPVYWLCLGKRALSYLPEILGMNLAMELSGVGGGYLNAKRFLRHYRFPTVFVDIHNTIDNVATGHSAWAVEAINEYMSRYYLGEESDNLWHRIRVGYESLAPIVKDKEDLMFFARTDSRYESESRIKQANLLHHDISKKHISDTCEKGFYCA